MPNSNTPKPVKAIVATVKIGLISIEGLMLPDGSYAIGVSQIAGLFSLNKSSASRDVKSLLGLDSPLCTAKSELNSNPVSIVSLEQFTKVVYKLAKKGNKLAEDMGEILFGLSIHQLFNDAFGVVFEKDERQEWLMQRQFHKKNFHPKLTKWLQKDGCSSQWDYARNVNIFKETLNLPLIYVGYYDAMQLTRLNYAETQYDMLRSIGQSHAFALQFLSRADNCQDIPMPKDDGKI